jgi:hypothetical protein
MDRERKRERKGCRPLSKSNHMLFVCPSPGSCMMGWGFCIIFESLSLSDGWERGTALPPPPKYRPRGRSLKGFSISRTLSF